MLMKRHTLSLWFCLVLAIVSSIFADSHRIAYPLPPPPESIITDDTYTVEELVGDIFVKGTCDNISNIQLIGSEKGVGYFENGSNSIGIERGIILATGKISNAQGPNNVTDESGNFYDDSGDQDLGILSTEAVKDAVGISFDFEPLDSFVTFSYVFASEEYCEFVGSIYNDVFGFFISGPGINGNFSNNAKNVALIPGTNQQVSINTINHQSNSQYYRHNELEDDMNLCNIPSNTSTVHQSIEYDGFTTKLTAALKLSPCKTYHIRLVVADLGDNFYDSAVFLEAESFNLGGEVSVKAAVGNTPTTPALEGCEDAYFLFERADPSTTSFPITVNYLISPTSSATLTDDYLPLPGSITIPSGSTSAQLPVSLINDGIDEPIEELLLTLDIQCACYTDSARMYIQDSPPLDVLLPDIAVCENESSILTPELSGGTGPYTYHWDDGSTSSSLIVDTNGPAQFSVTVEDNCGNSGFDSAQMSITTPPSALLNGTETICEGDTALLPLNLSGTAPWTITYSVNGIEQAPIENLWSTNTFLAGMLGGNYELLTVNDAACSGMANGTAYVDLISIQADIQTQAVSCFGGSDGALEVQLSGGIPPYDFFWLGGQASVLQLEELSAGEYILVVVDAMGCQKEFTANVESPAALSGATPDCEALSNGLLQISARGGTPPYLYSIDGERYQDELLFETLNAGETYNLYIQDAAGCLYQESFIMPTTYTEIVSLPPSVEYSLGSQETLMPFLQIPEHLIASIRWTPSANLSCVDCLQPNLLVTEEESYTIRIVDIYGCSGEATIHININDHLDLFAPTAFSPNNDNINDYFTLFANTYQVYLIKKLMVFDRWGGILFQNADFLPNDESEGWDGNKNSQPMDPGVYTYYAELELYDGSVRVVGGHIILIR